jgi:crossover junction endodeoxyribonuclease RusA
MELSLSFAVPGRPRPKERPRWDSRNKRTYTPHATSSYERTVAAYALQARQDLAVPWPLDATSYHLHVTLVFGRRPWPDADNVMKAIADGLRKVVWRDDNLVDSWSVIRIPSSGKEQALVLVKAFARTTQTALA